MRCAGSTPESCSEAPPTSALTRFSSLVLSGNFSTTSVHPQLVQDGMNATQSFWSWEDGRITQTSNENGLVSTTLYGRRYDLDDMLAEGSAVSLNVGHVIVVAAIVLCLCQR